MKEEAEWMIMAKSSKTYCGNREVGEGIKRTIIFPPFAAF